MEEITESRTSETIQLYDTIFRSFQDLEQTGLDESRAIVMQCLVEAGFDLEHLHRLSVLNVGTGREAVVFYALGVQSVYHYDLSSRSVNSLEKWRRDNSAHTVTTRQADICLPGALDLSAVVNFCYLRGVLHHLEDPSSATRNLIAATRPGAVMHFRIYRSGSFFFFVASFARSLVTPLDFDLTRQFAATYFGDESDPKGKVAETMDHLFVPVLSLWDVDELDRWFSDQGLLRLHEKKDAPYDHDDLSKASRGVSLYYKRQAQAAVDNYADPFPSSLNPETDFFYQEAYIVEALLLMERVREAARHWDDRARLQLVVKIMATAFTWEGSTPTSGQNAHQKLIDVLTTSLEAQHNSTASQDEL